MITNKGMKLNVIISANEMPITANEACQWNANEICQWDANSIHSTMSIYRVMVANDAPMFIFMQMSNITTNIPSWVQTPNLNNLVVYYLGHSHLLWLVRFEFAYLIRCCEFVLSLPTDDCQKTLAFTGKSSPMKLSSAGRCAHAHSSCPWDFHWQEHGKSEIKTFANYTK